MNHFCTAVVFSLSIVGVTAAQPSLTIYNQNFATVRDQLPLNLKAGINDENSEANHLGIALPRGKVRFYRQDSEGQLQFTGENVIDHTPKDETLRIYTGNAFDIVGERKRTNYKTDNRGHWIDETFEIKLRNHKKEAVEIRVVEHLYRWSNWEIKDPSNAFLKTDSQTMEFRIPLKPDEEHTSSYTVHYSW